MFSFSRDRAIVYERVVARIDQNAVTKNKTTSFFGNLTNSNCSVVYGQRSCHPAEFNAGPLFQNVNAAVVEDVAGFPIVLNGHAIGVLGNDIAFVDDLGTVADNHALLRPRISTFTSLDINIASVGQFHLVAFGMQSMRSGAVGAGNPNIFAKDDFTFGYREETTRLCSIKCVVELRVAFKLSLRNRCIHKIKSTLRSPFLRYNRTHCECGSCGDHSLGSLFVGSCSCFAGNNHRAANLAEHNFKRPIHS